MQANYSIRQFRSSDWVQFKALRLEALQTAAGMYCSSYAVEAARTDEHWQERLAKTDAAYFGLYHNDELVGMAGIMPGETEGQCEMIAAYIKSAQRGKGLSRLLYEARIAWVKDMGIKSLIISHRKSNIASMAANQHFGFKYTHTEEGRLWHDGVREDNVYCKPDL